jgi:preprotein translocase subunit YajC
MGNAILLILLLVILVVPSLMLQRKQKRHMDEIRTMQESLVLGDRVVTTAGIYGVVRGITADTVDLEISRGVNVTFEKMAIIKKVNVTEESHVAEPDADDHPENF